MSHSQHQQPDLENFCWDVRSCLFEIYPHLLIFPPPSRKVKSRWNFPPESFLTVSWWPQNLKVLLLPNVRLFLRGAATRDYSDITICNHPTAPQRPSLQVRSSALQKPFVEPPSPTFSSHVAPPRKLFTFVYLKFDICGPVCGNRRRTTGERAVVTKGVKNRKGSKKRARQGPRVI